MLRMTPPSGDRLLFRPDPVARESPRGYLCRVARAHRYSGPEWLADIAGIPPSALEREDRAKQLAHTLRLELTKWLQMSYAPIKGRGRFDRRSFLGQGIEAFQLNYNHPRICPCCLRGRPIWWAVWDLALVTACPMHRCLLIDWCSSCGKKLIWNRPAVHKCRCGADLRTATPEAANSTLLAINTAIYSAAAFRRRICEIELQRVSFPPVMAELKLDSLLRLIRFLGSIQENGRLLRKQRRFSLGDLKAAMQVDTAAAPLLMDWPRSFREMLRHKLPGKVANAGALSLNDVLGHFHRYLCRVLPRNEFGFLYDAFEKFVMEDWNGLIRHWNPRFSSANRGNFHWISAAVAAKTKHVGVKRIAMLVRSGELEGLFIKRNRHNSECWLSRESLNRWVAKRDAEFARYMSRFEVRRVLGLAQVTLQKFVRAGLIRYLEGSQHYLPKGRGLYFDREDVAKIKNAFERHAVPLCVYSKPGQLMALRHTFNNYRGHETGLAAAIRAVLDGSLVPAGYTDRFPGIGGYLFFSKDLRNYR